VLHVNDGVAICFELGNIQYWLIGVKFPNELSSLYLSFHDMNLRTSRILLI
jgi:hypothetical protein